jgi:D-alanyl-lipoteichoic acid acyltransferase DltB (MBOAT superfamily)
MLFNSYPFIFIYLPVVLIVFFAVGRFNRLAAALWLGVASVFFYAWWDWRFTGVLLISILSNFCFGLALNRRRIRGDAAGLRVLLGVAIAGNLLALAYFKYMNFFVTTILHALGAHAAWEAIVLPIGISFFTFTQIAFLVDTAKGKAREVNFAHYLLFVTYFPHLIAGPILHHSEMMPQFEKSDTYSPRARSLAIGMTVFIFGLFKKVVLADAIAPFADFAFSPSQSRHLTLVHAWLGVLAYTLQIYFDFSAYTDMAIGVSRLFNIKLPPNFESPYRALSIVDFWRRWHMTLSRFLRDYLYIPLGGNRRGTFLRYVNLLITMALGGLWHGAGWTFIVWGCLHGIYLIVNHAWQGVKVSFRVAGGLAEGLAAILAWGLTFLSVVVAWVFFRAPDIDTALSLLGGMLGRNGVTLPKMFVPLLGPAVPPLERLGVAFGDIAQFGGQGRTLRQAAMLTVGLLIIALFSPNIRQVMGDEELVIGSGALQTGSSPTSIPAMARWNPRIVWALASFVALVVSLSKMSRVSQFLYFQF